MDDLIKRKAAIDAMSAWDWQELYLPIHFKQLLEELPSIQPELRSENGKGLIMQGAVGPMNIDYLQRRLNDLKKRKVATRVEMDEAYDVYCKEPTDENLDKFDELRRKHAVISEAVSRAKNKINKAIKK